MGRLFDYVQNTLGERSTLKTLRSLLLWIMFFAIVVAVYWNIITVLTEQARLSGQPQEIQKRYSADGKTLISTEVIVTMLNRTQESTGDGANEGEGGLQQGTAESGLVMVRIS
jgi:hypothetical protein